MRNLIYMRLLGVALFALGSLGIGLGWRGGFAVSGFYFLLLTVGIILFVISRRQPQPKP